MADICMCRNETCPLKETCYRFNAIADDYWQTYSDFEYKDGCNHYWKMDFKPNKQIL